MKVGIRRFCAVMMYTLIFIVSHGSVSRSELSRDLTELSIEELVEIEVTSVSKKSEKLSGTASAIYVITEEDIRRSGITTIPEALRMVPGMEVARITANKWAVTSRGFNDRYANKLLVLMDGRSVYSPIYSGVDWDVQDTLLEDIERIEVIRGPGATLWGANAVNGVVNIITKSAKDTQGSLISLSAGTEERSLAAARYGGKSNNGTSYRIYTKYFDRDASIYPSGDDAADEWDGVRGGFRMDWDISDADIFTFQGDIYDSSIGKVIKLVSMSDLSIHTVGTVSDSSGGNILARWKRTFPDTSDMELQLYYDRAECNDLGFHQIRDAFDIDFQHRFRIGSRQEIIWGLGYRLTSDETFGSFTFSLDPANRTDQLFSAFVQDEIILIKDRLRLILGSKLEHNEYTGAEFQPSIRTVWTPGEYHTAWAAISRAIRTPARSESDARLNMGTISSPYGASLLSILGNSDQKSEDVLACEIGYRTHPNDHISLNIAAFYNIYEDVITLEPAGPFFKQEPSPPHLVIPIQFGNMGEGEVYGVEISANLKLTDNWRIFAGYSWMEQELRTISLEEGSEVQNKDISPEHQFKLRSYLNLPFNLEFDMMMYFVDRFSEENNHSFMRLDSRLAWHPSEALELSVHLENLLDGNHPEFNMTESIVPTEVERSIYGKITWRF